MELLLGRITASSYALTFDELPTPFRAVAVDLRTAKFVVLDHGSLALAMRATMSLPLIFPPVEFEGHVLVDGGAMNNVPADVARSMGADRVIAVNVGDLRDLTPNKVNYSMLGLAGETLDAMMRANSLKALAGADVVIDVPLAAYGSLDWRRYKELIAEGYKAAEAMRDRLLPLAVDDEAWQAWVSARAARRKTALPTPTACRWRARGSRTTATDAAGAGQARGPAARRARARRRPHHARRPRPLPVARVAGRPSRRRRPARGAGAGRRSTARRSCTSG